jgi:hypothetical protein
VKLLPSTIDSHLTEPMGSAEMTPETREPTTGPMLGPGRGTLLLADISGYTAFFRAVQEAHFADLKAGDFVPEAYPLLSSLLDGIVAALVPPFTLSKLEGDAVFAFDGARKVTGTDLVDLLHTCHDGFRQRLETALELMPCSCEACTRIGTLEVKFVVHQGEFVATSIAGHQELLGPDVTVAHLLLKNHVPELLGHSSYALFSDAATTALDVPLDGTREIAERYDHYPPVEAHVLALR